MFIQNILKYLYYKLLWNVEIWSYTYTWLNTIITPWPRETIKIWKYCSISWWVYILPNTTSHLKDKLTTYLSEYFWWGLKEWEWTIIWNDVWIWAWAIILWWRKIWTWAIIWAWTIVTKDVPPYAIVVGNPWVIKSYRFDKETIKKLLESKRRAWPIEKIKENYNLEFLSK
jgi:virginiamycin A acetyltransferase